MMGSNFWMYLPVRVCVPKLILSAQFPSKNWISFDQRKSKVSISKARLNTLSTEYNDVSPILLGKLGCNTVLEKNFVGQTMAKARRGNPWIDFCAVLGTASMTLSSGQRDRQNTSALDQPRTGTSAAQRRQTSENDLG